MRKYSHNWSTWKIYLAIIFISFVIMYCPRVFHPKQNISDESTGSVWINNITLTQDFVIQKDENLIIEPGTTIRIGEEINMILYGNLASKGGRNAPIVLTKYHEVEWGGTGGPRDANSGDVDGDGKEDFDELYCEGDPGESFGHTDCVMAHVNDNNVVKNAHYCDGHWNLCDLMNKWSVDGEGGIYYEGLLVVDDFPCLKPTKIDVGWSPKLLASQGKYFLAYGTTEGGVCIEFSEDGKAWSDMIIIEIIENENNILSRPIDFFQGWNDTYVLLIYWEVPNVLDAHGYSIAFSKDGRNWSIRGIDTSTWPNVGGSIVERESGTFLMYVGKKIYSSNDCVNWTKIASIEVEIESVIANNEGGIDVIGIDRINKTCYFYKSEDGVNFSRVSKIFEIGEKGMACDLVQTRDGYYVVAYSLAKEESGESTWDGIYIISSPDGKNWSKPIKIISSKASSLSLIQMKNGGYTIAFEDAGKDPHEIFMLQFDKADLFPEEFSWAVIAYACIVALVVGTIIWYKWKKQKQ